MSWNKTQRARAKKDNRCLFLVILTGKGGKLPGSVQFDGPVDEYEEGMINDFLEQLFRRRYGSGPMKVSLQGGRQFEIRDTTGAKLSKTKKAKKKGK